MKKLLAIVTLFLAIGFNAFAQDGYECFGVVAGKDATVDGSVFLGHNEDDSGDMMLNLYVVKASKKVKPGLGKDGEPVKLYGNKAVRYIWAEFPSMEIADAYINDYGVSVVSDGCGSREDRKDFTDGGVLYDIRVNVAKFAHSSREAVTIIGSLVEKYGYRGSGRSYIVADPNEAWVVSVVMGRHWVAQRVPDDKVMTIPNYYTIDAVNLADTVNFAGSADIVDYAVERGWYNPETDGEFSFWKAYCSRKNMFSKNNILHHTQALNIITDSLNDGNREHYPFAVTPARKVSIKDIMAVLTSHSTSVDYLFTYDARGNHPTQNSICNDRTIVSTIFQLRSWLPKEIGCIMWTAMGRPCTEVYVPVYLGIKKFPKGWGRFKKPYEAELKHFTDIDSLRAHYPAGQYWKYLDRWNNVSSDFTNLYSTRKSDNEAIQEYFFDNQEKIEQLLQKSCYNKNGKMRRPWRLRRSLSNYLKTCFDMI